MQDGWMELSLAGLPFPITVRPPVRLTDEELMTFCASNEILRVELEPNGDLTVMTPAGPGSGNLNAYLTTQIGKWAEADGRGEHFDSSSGFRLPDGAMRSPDASWISHERISALTRAERRGFWRICPEFIVELVSDSDPRGTVEEKMRMWIGNGAQLAWLIDPCRAEAIVYRPNAEPEKLTRPEYLTGEPPVVGLRLPMKRFWT
jgi:Uma2 family endonuclease